MTKFTAQKLGDLLTADARVARASRAAQYANSWKRFAAVVHVEADDGSWCELDAEDKAHAIRLADSWVANGARGASCRLLRGALSGMVHLRPFYTKFAEYSCDD